jgi:hypothetical protein
MGGINASFLPILTADHYPQHPPPEISPQFYILCPKQAIILLHRYMATPLWPYIAAKRFVCIYQALKSIHGSKNIKKRNTERNLNLGSNFSVKITNLAKKSF